MDTKTSLKDLLELSYNELEKLNLHARSITDPEIAQKEHVGYLKKNRE